MMWGARRLWCPCHRLLHCIDRPFALWMKRERCGPGEKGLRKENSIGFAFLRYRLLNCSGCVSCRKTLVCSSRRETFPVRSPSLVMSAFIVFKLTYQSWVCTWAILCNTIYSLGYCISIWETQQWMNMKLSIRSDQKHCASSGNKVRMKWKHFLGADKMAYRGFTR